MTDMLVDLARAISRSRAHDAAVYLLSNVPGLPPIVQTVHLLSIAIILGTAVILSLRVLGIAVPTQQPTEMATRLAPWTWWALPFLVASGMMFVLARPRRYFTNPMFGIKLALLIPALVATFILYSLLRSPSATLRRARICAGLSLVGWLGVVFAGRWIAYVDYVFPPEE